MKKIPPGPSGNILLGNYFDLNYDFLGTLFKAFKKYGNIVRLHIAWRSSYLISHPDFIKHVWMTNTHYYKNRIKTQKYVRGIFGDGLILSDGKSWKKQRPVVQAELHHKKIVGMIPDISQAIEESLNLLEESHRQNKNIDLYPAMVQLTMRVADRTLFGIGLNEEIDTLRTSINFLSNVAVKRTTRIINTPLFFPLKEHIRYKKELKTTQRVMQDILTKYRNNGSEKKGLLSGIIANTSMPIGSPEDDRRIRFELLALLWSSYETTALALTWTWYLLSQHPEVEEKLHAELDSVLGNRTPTYEDLDKLSYTRQVFKESLRLYPPAWILQRKSINKDSIGGFDVPPNTVIFACPFIIHRHPDFWEEPDKFMPERFDDKYKDKIYPFAYIPFGGGPRSCTGFHLAMTEGQLAIAMIAQKYRLKLATEEKIEVKPEFVLYPKNPILMTISQR